MFEKYEDWTISNQASVEIQKKAQRLSKAINVTIMHNRIRHIKVYEASRVRFKRNGSGRCPYDRVKI